MAKIIPITEHFQHFLRDRKESFWGDVYGPTKLAWQGFLELESQRQRGCWVHKMRNMLEKVRRRDYDEVKAGAQAMYLAESRAQAEQAFRRFRARWRGEYGAMVRRLERDLPELLSFYAFPRHLCRKLRTTNGIDAASWKCGGEPAPWSALST